MQYRFLYLFIMLIIALQIKAETNIRSFYIFSSDTLFAADSLLIADSTLVTDSTLIKDSVVIVDTLKPLFYNPIIEKIIFTLTKSKIDRIDFRSTGDLVNHVPSGFLRDLGILGQPSEITLYGLGFNNLSFLVNGINQNNRITNSFGGFSFQTDNVDSIIIRPITQAFLFNNYNNPASIEVIDKDSIYSIPYSRIKFYQAPDGEGMFDGRASLYLAQRINLTLGTSNQSIDSRYNNSDFGNWLAFAKLRYMMSNKFNFILDYSYRSSITSLYGGVDVSEITVTEPETIIYNPLQAPVNYQSAQFGSQSPRFQKETSHNFSGKILSTIIPYIKSDLTFYYTQNLAEFRQNQFTQIDKLPVIIDDNGYQTFGMNFNSSFTSHFFDLVFLYNIETNEIDADLFSDRFSFNTMSVAGIGSLKILEDIFTPTAYIKNLTFDRKNYFGFGLDLETNKFFNFSLSSGISYFEKPYNFIEQSISSVNLNNKIKNNTAQLGINYDSEIFSTQLSYFLIKQNDALLYHVNQYSDTLLINEVNRSTLFNKETSGFSLSGELNTWVIGVEYNGTYYIQNNDNEKLNPDYFLFAGIYYKDILFNRNLNLKTGLNFYLYGPRYFYDYDFEKSIPFQSRIPFGSRNYESTSSIKTGSNLRIDFFLSARIQESAIFFFIFENLLDQKYYVVPYYPLPSMGIRFGVAWEFLD